MRADTPHKRWMALEALATGAWAGLTQCALGFALLAGAGASATTFFAMTAFWLGGGALGALVVRGRAVQGLLIAAVLGSVFARAGLSADTWRGTGAVVVGMFAASLAGAYAGAYLGDRAARWGETRRLLLHENNGFVSGWLGGGVLLLASTPGAPGAVAGVLGALLVARELASSGARGRAIAALVVACALGWEARGFRDDDTPAVPAVARRALPALPDDPEAALDDLLADDLELVASTDVNGTVARLDFARGARRFRAKWKPMGPEGSEVQDGFDGNNAPRAEAAAWRLNRLLFGPRSTARHLVAPVVVRAFHRDVPCERACAHVPRLSGLASEATFPAINDHLVIGALTYWIDGASRPERFAGGLWDPRRFASTPEYRRSFSDLCAFLYVIAHGDANYADNFLARDPALDRLFSIDNGRAFDGVTYFTDGADPDWAPFGRLSPDALVAPGLSLATLRALESLDRATLAGALRVTGAVDLRSGRAVREPMATAPMDAEPGLARRGRGTFVGAWTQGEGEWVVLGVGEAGIDDVMARARALAARWRRVDAATFGE